MGGFSSGTVSRSRPVTRNTDKAINNKTGKAGRNQAEKKPTSSSSKQKPPKSRSSRQKSGQKSKRRNKLSDSVRKSVNRYLKDLNGEEASRVYDMVLCEVEKPLLDVVMKYCDHNQSKAARVLGINRNTLRKKLAAHGINPDD